MQLDTLQAKYLCALDGQDMKGWLDCFSPQGSYLCISRENEEQGMALPLMMDDCYARLLDRVKYVTEVWAGTFEDYSTRHFVQRMTAVPTAPTEYSVVSNVMVAYTSSKGRSEILVAGTYDDRVRLADGAAKFISKKVILDTTVTPRYLVYPI